MDLDQIKELLRIVSESGVAEVEIEPDEFKLIVRKNAPPVIIQPSLPAYGMGYPMGGFPPPAPAPQAPPLNNLPAPAAAEAAPQQPGVPSQPQDERKAANEEVVKAPIVGTFYRAPAPGEEDFVNVGDEVKPGDVLCIIEAMKLMNEIECEVSGIIRKIVAENAQPVEYDQPLFVIETS